MARMESRLDIMETHMCNMGVMMKYMKTQIGQLANALKDQNRGHFPSDTEVNPKEKYKEIELRSGKQIGAEGSKSESERSKGTEKSVEEKMVENSAIENKIEKKFEEKKSELESKPMYKPQLPYPQRFKKKALDEQFTKFLEIFKKIHINIPFADALEQMPNYAKFIKDVDLELGEVKPTTVTLQLADRSITYPCGIVEDVLVKVDKFIFPADFVILDMEEYQDSPLIFRRPFLATTRALIDVHKGELTLRVGIDDPLKRCLLGIKEAEKYEDLELCEQEAFLDGAPIEKAVSSKEKEVLENSATDVSIETHDLKELPAHLCYAFLGENSTCLRRLNPAMKEVVKNEELKLLNAGIINALSDSSWVSPVQVVPKEGGITVVKNDKNELISTRTMTGECLLVCVMHRLLNIKGIQSFLAPEDQEKTTFTCPYGTFAFKPILRVHLAHLLSGECLLVCAFEKIKRALITTSIMIVSDWKEPFEFMCDASDYVVGAVLGQRRDKLFRSIYYVSRTMDAVQQNYTTTEKDMFAVVFTFDKFRPCLIGTKVVVYTDHAAIHYMFAKKDAKTCLIRWILLLQEFDFEVKDKKIVKIK
ncbi:uncharacterized protein [Henckelia pumila]|uniref:uncharacterized protein n=1 Tax=Henckelia pumila TaxID=405737 RepID=UPI003C6E22DE